MLSIDAYDAAERTGAAPLGNDALWAFAPTTFAAIGYPARVASDHELLRYADPMKEAMGRLVDAEDKFLRPYSLRTRFTRAEAALLLRLRRFVEGLTEESFGRRVAPLNSLMSAVALYRAVEALAEARGTRLSILEVGPGAAYLGALLCLAGHRYVAMDNAQAFYLWQNRFLGGLSGPDFVELAQAPDAAPRRVTHLPWWTFAGGRGHPQVDLVICDQAFCEMHPWALRFVTRAAARALGRGDPGLLLFAGYGHTQNSVADVDQCLAVAGFERLADEVVHAFAPAGRGRPELAPVLKRGVLLDGETDLLAAPEFLKVPRALLADDYRFREAAGIWPTAALFVTD